MENDTQYVEHLAHIKERVKLAKSFSEGWHENIRKWRDLYNFKHYKGSPLPGESRYEDPTYTNTVDLAVGMFQANQQIWSATGWTPAIRESKGSDQVEKFLAGVIQINNDRNEYNISYEVNLHFVRDGGAVLYAPYDPDIEAMVSDVRQAPDLNTGDIRPELFMAEVPVVTRVIDPLKMYLLPGGPRRWCAVMRVEDMSVYDVETEYGVRIERYNYLDKKGKIDKKGQFIDYWDMAFEDYPDTPVPTQADVQAVTKTRRKFVIRNAVVFEDQFILHPDDPLKVMNGYKDYPYTISFFKPVMRDESTGWHSILRPLESTVLALAKAVNRRQRQLDVFTSMPLVAKTRGDRTVDMDPGLGKIVQLSEDEDLAFPQWQGNPPDVREQIDFFRSRVQQSGFSDVMFGSGPNQVSGYALSQMGDQNRIRLEQPVTHLEQLWTWWARKVINLMSHFAPQASVRIYGRMRDVDFAEEIKGIELKDYQVTCEIKPEFPNEEVRKHAMATQVMGILSPNTIMEKYLNIQQPEDENKRRLISAAQNSPEAMKYAMMYTFAEMAQDGDKVAMAALQAMQQASTEQGGRPNEPRNPEQLTGTQFPDGQAPPQSRGNAPPGEGALDTSNKMANASPGMDGSVI